MFPKLITFFFISFLFLVSVKAQEGADNSISGIIIDSSSRQPLEYATITVYKVGDTKPVTGSTSNKNGAFVVNEVSEGVYNIVFEFIGYTPTRKEGIVINKKNASIDFKQVTLARKKGELQTVTVVAQGKLVENKLDKLVFNAEKDLTSQTGVATDVLKKVPMVSVDADGNVELAGNGGIRFLINGKPSSAFGSSITDVLQTIPASQIKSIEVITNPGAKYDAQGMGGIINIILKSSSARGYNGNVSLTAGTRMENGSVNFNVRKGDFGMNAFISGNARLRSSVPYTSERLTTDSNSISSFRQSGSSNFERHGFQAGTGFDWTIAKKNNISGSFTYNQFGNVGEGINNQVSGIKGSVIPDVLTLLHASNNSGFQNIDAGLNYKRTFDKEDQELTVSVNSSFGTATNLSDNYQMYVPQDSIYYATKSTNPGHIQEHEFTVDYNQPLKKDVILGIGSKVNLYDIKSNSDVMKLQGVTNSYVSDPFQTNNLDYHQQVYALYSELSFPLFKTLEAKIGGRYERTEINTYYSNAQQQVATPGYNTFVPSIFFSKKIGETQTVKLSYSKRIERPDYHDLNPFVNTNDPKNLSAGNPYLQPEIGHRFELSYNKNIENVGSFMATLFYRINQHDIQPYIFYYPTYKVGDSTYTNVAVSTRENIGAERNMGVNLFGDLHINSKFSLRSNVFFFLRHIKNDIDPSLDYNSFLYRFNLNATYQVGSTLVAEAFGNFNSVRHQAQGIYPSFTSYTLAIRKQFWKKKGSLALTATNPFSEYVTQKTQLSGTNFTVNSVREIPFRSFGLNFSWKFGKLEFKKQKEERDNNLNAPAE